LRQLCIRKRLHSVQRGQRFKCKHQPAKCKRIVFRALDRLEVTGMGDETSQDFERHALDVMFVISAHPARAHDAIPLPEEL
jgi:hypothetical protein